MRITTRRVNNWRYRQMMPYRSPISWVSIPPCSRCCLPGDSADLAIVQGLGYPDPNRSHFRSIEIWQTASEADQFLTSGWLTAALPEVDHALQSVVISGSPGALQGESNQFGLTSSDVLLNDVHVPDGQPPTQAIAHVLAQRQTYNEAVALLSDAFDDAPELTTEFANDPFSRGCQLSAELFAAGIQPTIIHLSLGSFDTHSNQRNAHDNLLSQWASGLAALREELILQGVWQNVCIASYAEFGPPCGAKCQSGHRPRHGRQPLGDGRQREWRHSRSNAVARQPRRQWRYAVSAKTSGATTVPCPIGWVGRPANSSLILPG